MEHMEQLCKIFQDRIVHYLTHYTTTTFCLHNMYIIMIIKKFEINSKCV